MSLDERRAKDRDREFNSYTFLNILSEISG